MIQTTSTSERSVGNLLKDLTDETRMLLRQEVELAKAEMSEKAARLGRGAMYVAIGGAVLYAGVLALIAAACIGLAVALNMGLDGEVAVWLGPLLVGVVVAIVGYAFVHSAISTFREESLTPRITLETLRENKEWLKDQITTSDTHTR